MTAAKTYASDERSGNFIAVVRARVGVTRPFTTPLTSGCSAALELPLAHLLEEPLVLLPLLERRLIRRLVFQVGIVLLAEPFPSRRARGLRGVFSGERFDR